PDALPGERLGRAAGRRSWRVPLAQPREGRRVLLGGGRAAVDRPPGSHGDARAAARVRGAARRRAPHARTGANGDGDGGKYGDRAGGPCPVTPAARGEALAMKSTSSR